MVIIEPAALALFCLAAFALIVVPGPAVFYIVARSVAQGTAAGMVSALGVGLGATLHVAAAALGVSAVLMASATAFTLLKLAGAAYLIYLGVRTLLSRQDPGAVRVTDRRALSRVFLDGALVNALNPKVALFFLAFLPQFVSPAAGSVPAQMVFLGALFVLIGIASDAVYALLAGGLTSRFRASVRGQRLGRWFSGSLYLALGAGTAVMGAGEKPAS